MKILLYTKAVLLSLCLLSHTHAATLTNQFHDLPAELQRHQTWTNQNVVLHFTETIAAEDGWGGACNFSATYGSLELWPGRLVLDFSLLERPVSRIEIDIYDKSGPGTVKLFAYRDGASVAQVTNTTSRGHTMVLDLGYCQPDTCALGAIQAYVNEIRLFTIDTPLPQLGIQTTGGVLTISWPTNPAPFTLEKTDALSPLLGWTPQTDNIQSEGSNFVYRLTAPAGSQFFRLRPN